MYNEIELDNHIFYNLLSFLYPLKVKFLIPLIYGYYSVTLGDTEKKLFLQAGFVFSIESAPPQK